MTATWKCPNCLTAHLLGNHCSGCGRPSPSFGPQAVIKKLDTFVRLQPGGTQHFTFVHGTDWHPLFVLAGPSNDIVIKSVSLHIQPVELFCQAPLHPAGMRFVFLPGYGNEFTFLPTGANFNVEVTNYGKIDRQMYVVVVGEEVMRETTTQDPSPA
jgi:hypothetical protein